MTNISTEERTAMRDSFSRLLAQRADEDALRKAIATDLGYDPALWQEMAEMGIIGLMVDPQYDGLGGDAILLEMLMEEAGACLLSSPFISTSVLATSLISASSNEQFKTDTYSEIISGDCIVAAALTGDQGLWTIDDVSVVAKENENGWQLDGSASFVMHAEAAHKILVAAKSGNGLQLFMVDAKDDQLSSEKLKTNDPGLRLSKLSFSGTPAKLITGVDKQAIGNALDLARIALAGEQAGGVKRIFDITVDYLQTRYQFGRQIGSYQAMKHMAADMLVEVETATSAARHAAESHAKGANDTQTLISLAGFACADAYRDVTAQAIQMHGGIAYTWEHPAHLYWRRARTGLWLFGSSDHHRDQYLSQLEAA